MAAFALTGASIFDGEAVRQGAAAVIADGRIEAICREEDLPASTPRHHLDGGLLAPGFVDIQVNGGGGVLFNDTPTVEGIRRICEAHRRFGATALLPTVITDVPEVTFAAIEAAGEAMRQGVPGCIGIHVEGPFIARARKGAHDPALIRAMTEADVQRLVATEVRPLLLTVAPESVTDDQIRRLSGAGIIVSLGHSDIGFAGAASAFRAGARCGTHLFNAMSQFGHREPGLVGAILDDPAIWCGIIADGHHVHPASIAAALRAKRGAGKVLAITDAMSAVGVAQDVFQLNGRTVTRRDGRLTLDDGTLAGSDLTMIAAVRYLRDTIGIPLAEALRMASLYPAQFLGDPSRGRLAAGCRADIVWIDGDDQLRRSWIGGEL